MTAGSYSEHFIQCDHAGADGCGNRFAVPDEALPYQGQDGSTLTHVRRQAALAGWQTSAGQLDYCPSHRVDGVLSDQVFPVLGTMQEMVMEVLVSRCREGEQTWNFPVACRRALELLAARGLVSYESGPVPRHWRARFTDAGVRAWVKPGYRSPSRKLLDQALFLLENGNNAPGHEGENWGAWSRQAEVFGRSRP